MTKREAYARGKSSGMQAARYCVIHDEDIREANCQCSTDQDSERLSMASRECLDCLTQAAHASEQASRDFSPFEHVAHAINGARDPEGQWESYDAGVAAGIKAGVRSRLASVQGDGAQGAGR